MDGVPHLDQGVLPMSKFLLRREVNKDRSFTHVVNFLTANNVMSYADTLTMFRAFHSNGEDVLVNVPDAIDQQFMDALKSVNLRCEKT